MKKLLLFLTALVTGTLVSCQRDNLSKGEEPSANSFSLNCYVKNNNVTTRASVAPEAGEEDVNTLHVLFFENSGAKAFVEAYDASPTDGNPLNMSAPIKINLLGGSQISHAKAYKLLIVANVEDYIKIEHPGGLNDWLASLAGKSYNEVFTTYMAMVDGAVSNSVVDDSNAISATNLLMSAVVEKDPSESIVDVELIRALCRFDVENKAIAAGFELVSASVWNAFPKASIWESNYNDYTPDRIQRYYGIKSPSIQSGFKGSLYAFENIESSPKQNDKKTTCLILGIKDTNGTGLVTYYRVNINALNFGQQIRRNNVYNVVIKNVNGPGANDEETAYTSGKTLLDININQWNPDNQGNIQYDGDNILAIPTSHVVFTPLAETREFDIFTLGEGTLEISKSQLPPGITATLTGKKLTISVTANEDLREGSIELRFGNLKAPVQITQTGEKDEFLNLSINTIPMFEMGAGLQFAENVVVTSSGDWNAKIYNAGFTLVGGSDVQSKDGVTGGNFSIATYTANTGSQPRYAFILVSLKSNPEVSRTLVLSQKGTGAIDIMPSPTSINFNADGTTTDATTFTVTSGGDWMVATTGSNASKFIVTPTTGISGTTFTISASNNIEASELTASLRIYLKDAPNVQKIVPIKQKVHTLNIDPNAVPSISYKGGTSPDFTVVSTAPWSATMTSENNTSSFSSTLNNIFTTSGTTGQKFNVTFPKLTTPNVAPKATITVTITGTSVKKTIEVYQSMLVAKDFTVTSARYYYDTFAPSGSTSYRERLGKFAQYLFNSSLFGKSSSATVFCGAITNDAQTSGSTSTVRLPGANTKIYLHNNVRSNGAEIRAWLEGSKDRVLILTNHHPDQPEQVTDNFSVWGYYGANGGTNSLATNKHTITGNVNTSKIHKYLLQDGPFTIGTPLSGIGYRTGDAIAGTLSAAPSTFVPLIKHPSNGRTVMGIDPTRRIIYIGDPEIFGTNDSSNRDNWNNQANIKFLQNVVAWAVNVTQYGEEFSDQFID